MDKISLFLLRAYECCSQFRFCTCLVIWHRRYVLLEGPIYNSAIFN